MTNPLLRASSPVLGVMAATVIAACDSGSEDMSIAQELPAGARIGNVATAELQPLGGGAVSGTVTFAEVPDGVRIQASVAGLSAGEHGLHLHEFGDCSASDGSSAGGHWSPASDPHGAPSDSSDEHHAGDFGNLTAEPDGTASMDRRDAELALVGEYGVVGRSVIVHTGMDELESVSGGDSGKRVACGVIEWGTDRVQ